MTTDLLWCRRTFLVSSGASLLSGCVHPRAHQSAAIEKISALEREVGGRVGVAVLDTHDGSHLAHRGDEQFAMCSTFKWLLAAAVLAQVDRGAITLDQSIRYGSVDVLSNSPVTAAHVGAGALTIDLLCAAVVEVSDNTAANLLLPLVDGPSGLTSYLRKHGDRYTRLDRNELTLNTNLLGDPRDTTTPNSMVETMNRLLVGDALSANSRDRLIGWLKNCRTGLSRIRSGIPSDWIAGDKTGTGYNGAVNDVAIAWPPKRPPLLIAVYLSESQASVEALSAIHARVGGIVATHFA